MPIREYECNICGDRKEFFERTRGTAPETKDFECKCRDGPTDHSLNLFSTPQVHNSWSAWTQTILNLDRRK